MRMIKRLTPILCSAFLLLTSGSVNALQIVDQSQTGIDYGFWFDDEVRRWQEFTPSVSELSAVEIYIFKFGSPGDLFLEVTNVNFFVLGKERVAETDIEIGWLKIVLSDLILLNVGDKYRLHVYADQDSSTIDDRLFWRGSNFDNYNSEALNDVIHAWPNYDYAFQTWVSVPEPTTLVLMGLGLAGIRYRHKWVETA